MAEDLEEKVLDLKLFRDDDDEEDLTYKRMLQALVDGTVTPRQAAADLDEWVTREANNRLAQLLKRPDPKNLTPEEIEQGITMRSLSPNASGNIDMVFGAIAKLCSAFPPFHPGQDAIVHFIEALRALPQHEVPDKIPEVDDDNEHGQMITLWPFGGTWLSLTAIFHIEAEEYSYPYSGIETPCSETQLRWRNFQSAIARITALGLIDCGFLSALGDILPSSRNYPDLKERKIGGPNRISGDTVAAAQWIMWPKQGRFAYQQCKALQETGRWAMWSPERWQLWKNQFSFIAGDERFTPEARLAARLSREQMMVYEKEDNFD